MFMQGTFQFGTKLSSLAHVDQTCIKIKNRVLRVFFSSTFPLCIRNGAHPLFWALDPRQISTVLKWSWKWLDSDAVDYWMKNEGAMDHTSHFLCWDVFIIKDRDMDHKVNWYGWPSLSRLLNQKKKNRR